MSQREEVWRKRTTKEIEKRKKLEEYFKQALKEAKESKKTVVMGGPDCEVYFCLKYFISNIIPSILILMYLYCSDRRVLTAHSKKMSFMMRSN